MALLLLLMMSFAAALAAGPAATAGLPCLSLPHSTASLSLWTHRFLMVPGQWARINSAGGANQQPHSPSPGDAKDRDRTTLHATPDIIRRLKMNRQRTSRSSYSRDSSVHVPRLDNVGWNENGSLDRRDVETFSIPPLMSESVTGVLGLVFFCKNSLYDR